MSSLVYFFVLLILSFFFPGISGTLEAKACRKNWSGAEPEIGILYMPLEEAKAFVQGLKIETKKKFFEFIKSEDRPYDLPLNPSQVYAEEWKGWDDFFGTTPSEDLNVYEAIAEILKQTGEKSAAAAAGFDGEAASGKTNLMKKKQNQKGNLIHRDDFHKKKKTQTSRKIKRSKNWMSYEEAKALMRKEEITTHKEFRNWMRKGNRPKNFPSSPDKVYADEWKGWKEFFGTQ